MLLRHYVAGEQIKGPTSGPFQSLFFPTLRAKPCAAFTLIEERKMADNLTVYGLKHKKARLLGQRVRIVQQMKPLLAKISELQAQLSAFESECRVIEEQVAVLTNTLEALGSSQTVEAVKDCAKWANGQRRGSFKTELLKALHQTDVPQTTREIAITIGKALGLDTDNPVVWNKLRHQTKDYLNLLKKSGDAVLLQSNQAIGGSLWQRP